MAVMQTPRLGMRPVHDMRTPGGRSEEVFWGTLTTILPRTIHPRLPPAVSMDKRDMVGNLWEGIPLALSSEYS